MPATTVPDPSAPRALTGPEPRRLTAIGAVIALSIAAFCYVTTENLPIGLLTLMADDLRTSLPAVGLLVTGYGITVALVSIPLTRLTLRVPRRALLIAMLAIFVGANCATALATGYWLLLVARIVTALTQAIFWAVIATAATGLFPARVRGRVIALTFAGGSLALVLGVPAGTWLGQQAGWRVAFLALSGIGLMVLVALTILLPTVGNHGNHAATGTNPDPHRYRILLTVTALSVTGMFTTYTYIIAFLIEVSGFSASSASALLLLYGAGGLVGTALTGSVVDRHPRVAMVAPIATMTCALLGLFTLGTMQPVAVTLMALASGSLSSVPTAMQSRIMEVAPGSTELASAANSAIFNLGIASGALLGGALLAHLGVRSIALAGGLVTAIALAVALAEAPLSRLLIRAADSRATRRASPPRSETPPPARC